MNSQHAFFGRYMATFDNVAGTVRADRQHPDAGRRGRIDNLRSPRPAA
jgi:hypothetical protein